MTTRSEDSHYYKLSHYTTRPFVTFSGEVRFTYILVESYSLVINDGRQGKVVNVMVRI